MSNASAAVTSAYKCLKKPGQLLLRVEGLRKAFGGQVVLGGLDLELHRGEVVLLRGENGSGKTTLLNILTGNLEPDAGVIEYLADGTPRSYRFPRRWWQELNPLDHFTPEFVAREDMGRTWQDVRLFGCQSLRDNIAVATRRNPGESPILAILASNRSTRREIQVNLAADAMLGDLGLAGREEASADKISLGQSKRVAIARAIAAGAKILFLDEPLSGLDRSGITEVLTLLETLVRNEHLTLVIVEHVFSEPHLYGIATTDWLLDKGTIKTKEMKSHIVSPVSSASSRPPWISHFVSDDTKIIDEPLPRGAHITRVRRDKIFQPLSRPVLELRDLVVKRAARTVIGLDDQGASVGFSLSLRTGEVAILQAPNGWGKSTLIDAVIGLAPVHSGTMTFDGRNLANYPVWCRARLGLRVLRSNRQSFPNLRTKDVLRLAGRSDWATAAGDLGPRYCSSLSGGESQRVALSSMTAISRSPVVFLLDEPFAALDGNTTREMAQSIASLSLRVPILLLSPRMS